MDFTFPSRDCRIEPRSIYYSFFLQGNDDADMYHLLGSKDYRNDLDKQFKNPKSNSKIAIVVDMLFSGFDVPELDTIYIDKPLQKHNLIQTLSRVNRKF